MLSWNQHYWRGVDWWGFERCNTAKSSQHLVILSKRPKFCWVTMGGKRVAVFSPSTWTPPKPSIRLPKNGTGHVFQVDSYRKMDEDDASEKVTGFNDILTWGMGFGPPLPGCNHLLVTNTNPNLQTFNTRLLQCMSPFLKMLLSTSPLLGGGNSKILFINFDPEP